MKAFLRTLLPSVLVSASAAAAVGPGHAVTARLLDPDRLEVVVEETVLKWSATGRLLGHLNKGAPVERLGGRGDWTRVGIHGWMWRKSLERSGDGYRVTPPRENLRAGPNGEILGTLERGVKVRRVGGNEKWFEIEMIGWLPDSSVRAPAAARGADEAEAEEKKAREAAHEEPEAAGGEPVARPPGPASSTGAPAVNRIGEEIGLRSAPGGTVVTNLSAGTVVRAVERRGAWTRVQVEGWVPSESVGTGASTSGPEAVALDPARFAGRRVQWTLEHVALQKAEEWRSDFEPGEWYDLVRVPDRMTYVYLVVPPALLEEFRGLSPFETIRVEGRIRSGKSELTGNPILEVARLLP